MNLYFKQDAHSDYSLEIAKEGNPADWTINVYPHDVDQGDLVAIEISFMVTLSGSVKKYVPQSGSNHLYFDFFPKIPGGSLQHVQDEIYSDIGMVNFSLDDKGGVVLGSLGVNKTVTVISKWQLDTSDCINAGYDFRLFLKNDTNNQLSIPEGAITPSNIYVRRSALNPNATIRASLQPSSTPFNAADTLGLVILKSTEALGFDKYKKFMDFVFCGEGDPKTPAHQNILKQLSELRGKRLLPFTDTDAYRSIKTATEAFLMVNCGVDYSFTDDDVAKLYARVTLIDGSIDKGKLDDFWNEYLIKVNGNGGVLPYLEVIRNKLANDPIKKQAIDQAIEITYDANSKLYTREYKDRCYGIINDKLAHPCFLELIWSYWHEECMLVQTMNVICRRFQNVRGRYNDPLANLEIDPLRPLNNLLWGYIQDEQHRLTVRRRTLEYDHHYGISLQGKAVGNLRKADSRSKFLEAFHNLLNITVKFYKQLDDTTFVADGFPVLNALKEVHLILSEGAHNQYGDLPSTARIEMLMQQWLLSRAEFREFIPTRIMVAYPEPWMDRVAAMNTLQGWTNTNVIHFRDLGVFGEQLLLSIRFGNWAAINDRYIAANWAKFWREQVQGYIHAYRTVTGVDLSREDIAIDAQQPSLHLMRRLKEQHRAMRF